MKLYRCVVVETNSDVLGLMGVDLSIKQALRFELEHLWFTKHGWPVPGLGRRFMFIGDNRGWICRDLDKQITLSVLKYAGGQLHMPVAFLGVNRARTKLELIS